MATSNAFLRLTAPFCVYLWASQVTSVVKNPPANAGDIREGGSFPELGRSPRRRYGNPLQYSCLENPMDRGAWWATVHGITKSRTWLKRLSTHTHMFICVFPIDWELPEDSPTLSYPFLPWRPVRRLVYIQSTHGMSRSVEAGVHTGCLCSICTTNNSQGRGRRTPPECPERPGSILFHHTSHLAGKPGPFPAGCALHHLLPSLPNPGGWGGRVPSSFCSEVCPA